MINQKQERTIEQDHNKNNLVIHTIFKRCRKCGLLHHIDEENCCYCLEDITIWEEVLVSS